MENKKKFKFQKIELVGFFAGLIAVFGGFEQIIHTHKTQQVDGISYPFILGALISSGMWLIYHYYKKGGGGFIVTIIMLLGVITLLIMKIIISRKNKNKNKKKQKKQK